MYLSLIQRITLGFSVVILLVFAIGSSSYFSQAKMAAQLELTASTLTEILDESNTLVQHLQNANRAILVHANSHDEARRTRLRNAFEQSSLSYQNTFDSLKQKLQVFPKLSEHLLSGQDAAKLLLSEASEHLNIHDQRVLARSASAQELKDFEDEWLFFIQDMQYMYSTAEAADKQQAVWDIDFLIKQGKGAEGYLQKILAVETNEQMKDIKKELDTHLVKYHERDERVIQAMPDDEDSVIFYGDLLDRAIAKPEGALQQHILYVNLNVQSNKLMTKIADDLDIVIDNSTELIDMVREVSQHALSDAKESSSESQMLNLALVLIAACIAIGVATTVVIAVRQPMVTIINKLISLEKGDLTQRIDMDYRSELGQIALHINQLAEQLNSLISKVQHSADTLSGVASESHSMSDKTSQDVASQQKQTDCIATAVTEMEHAVHEVASHAVDASAQVEGVVQLARGNMQNMQKNLQFVGELQNSLSEATDRIQQLSTESEQIGEILTVIQSISEQTNLLALNAAIEAARAGEHGRGFAVVADEVRSLATRTQQSADEISTMIVSLQEKSRQAVTIVESNRDHAGESVSQTNQAYDSLQDMVAKLTSVNDMSRSIATASEEQSAVAKDVAQNVVGISDMSASIACDAEELARNSESLSKLSDEQSALVSQFKI